MTLSVSTVSAHSAAERARSVTQQREIHVLVIAMHFTISCFIVTTLVSLLLQICYQRTSYVMLPLNDMGTILCGMHIQCFKGSLLSITLKIVHELSGY